MKPIPIPAEVYQTRRKRLAQKSGADLIVLAANMNSQKSRDVAYEFEQDKSFLYLTGINEPGWFLIIDCISSKEYLVQPQRNAQHALFEGEIDLHGGQKTSGIQNIISNRQANTLIRESSAKKVGILEPFPRYIAVFEMFTHPMRSVLKNRMRRLKPQAELVNIASTIAQLRCVKDEYELQRIKQAIEITADVLNPIMENIQNYQYEYEIEAEIAYEFRKRQTKEAYTSIVSAGVNTAQLHYNLYTKKINPDDLILFDIGAIFQDYCADISRTLPYRSFTSRQKDVYDAVLDTYNYALSRLKPGVIPLEYEREVEQYIGEHMKSLGLISEIERSAIRKLFPSYTSHFLGLDVHDAGSLEEPLQPGMVLTVEPGIYIPNEEIGVRIEDDIVITETGYDNLSKDITKII